eukprot:scpid107093/ scgid31926/ 
MQRDLLMWPSDGGVSIMDVDLGRSHVSITLPELSESQRSDYSDFEVEYRRIGDSSWISAGSVSTSEKTFVLSENLDAGNYEVRVRGTDGSTVHSEHTPHLQFFTTGKVPVSISLPTVDPLAISYSVEVLLFNTSSGKYQSVSREDNLRVGDFPHGVPSGVVSGSQYVTIVTSNLADGSQRSIQFVSLTAEPIG